jgi:small subunit ribosomal protein S2
MSVPLSLMSLFNSGAHRGNKRSRVNPIFKSNIYGYDSNGIAIINLANSLDSIESSVELLKTIAVKKKQVLLVGTANHIKKYIPQFSESFTNGPMPYVDNRWLGGTLTNWPTVKKTLKSLEKLESIINNQDFYTSLSRNEQLNLQREREKILKFFRGLVYLKGSKPGCVIVLDSFYDPIAIKEAELLKIPVILLTSTHSKVVPNNMNYTTIINTNSVKVIKSIVEYFISEYNKSLAKSVEITITKEKESVTA